MTGYYSLAIETIARHMSKKRSSRWKEECVSATRRKVLPVSTINMGTENSDYLNGLAAAEDFINENKQSRD